jgi:exodeoxyribonuclease III
MKIATYNVNGVNGRLEVLLNWLKESEPDIVCLQELKSPNEKFPKIALEKAGYNAIWHGQKSWNGVAVLSHFKMEEIGKSLPGDPEDVQSRYMEVMVENIVICNLYLPNGNPRPGPKFDYKLKWFERLQTRAKTLQKMKAPALLIGDFNVIPTEMDVYKPESWKEDALFAPEVREAFKQLKGKYWTDAIRLLYPEEKIYTFWDYFRNAYARNAGLRLDHFLLSPPLKERLRSGGVDQHVRGWNKTSDHAPVWIELGD